MSLLTLSELLKHDRRGRWLHRLRHNGHLQQYVNGLATMDRVEAEAALGGRAWGAQGAYSDLGLDPTTALGIQAGLPGFGGNDAWGTRGVSRFPGADEVGIVDGTPLPTGDTQQVNVRGLASAFECTLSLLIRVGSVPDGCLALTEYGVVSVLANLRWLRQAVEKARSLPIEGPAAAMYMQQRFVRLAPVLQLLSAMLSARPNDLRVSEQVCTFVKDALPLFQSLLRMCGPLDAKPSLTIIRLTTLVVNCLALAAASPGAKLETMVRPRWCRAHRGATRLCAHTQPHRSWPRVLAGGPRAGHGRSQGVCQVLRQPSRWVHGGPRRWWRGCRRPLHGPPRWLAAMVDAR